MVKDAPLMTVLITGGTGRLGSQLVKVFPDSQHPAHGDFDVVDEGAVNKTISKVRPKLVIHSAALTGIKQCEEDKTSAWSTNVLGTENLLRSCLEYSPMAYFVYVSTACVFRGDRGDYTESDIPYPKNYYALTKLLGKSAVRNSRLSSLIIRTNFVPRSRWPYPSAFTD